MGMHIVKNIKDIFHRSIRLNKAGFEILNNNPQILVYPYLAALVILITFPLANDAVYHLWHHVGQSSVLSTVDDAPSEIKVTLGLVTFSVFYTGLISSYFTCAVAADTLVRLEGKQVHMLHGLIVALKKFPRITMFGILAIFFFPLSLLAQRKARGSSLFWILSSSLAIHMPQLAAVIVSEKTGVMDSIRLTIDRLGKLWPEGLMIRVYMLLIFFVITSLGFLPSAIEHAWSEPKSAHLAAWIIGSMITATSYVAIKVVGTVLSTTIYYHAKNHN